MQVTFLYDGSKFLRWPPPLYKPMSMCPSVSLSKNTCVPLSYPCTFLCCPSALLRPKGWSPSELYHRAIPFDIMGSKLNTAEFFTMIFKHESVNSEAIECLI